MYNRLQYTMPRNTVVITLVSLGYTRRISSCLVFILLKQNAMKMKAIEKFWLEAAITKQALNRLIACTY